MRRQKGQHPEPWENQAQVVDVRRSRLEPSMVEVAAVVKDTDGSFIDRRIRCPGGDLNGDLVFHPWPSAAAEQGSPSQPRWVQDHRFATAEEAMRAATEHSPPARASEWLAASTFKEELSSNWFTRRLEPVGADLSPLQTVLVWAVFGVIAGPLTVWATRYAWQWQLSDAERPSRGLLEELQSYGILTAWWLVLLLVLGTAGRVTRWLRGLMARHNLDLALNGNEASSLMQAVHDELHTAGREFGRLMEQRRSRRPEAPVRKTEEASRAVRGRRREPGRHEAPRPPQRALFRRRLER